MAHMIDMSNDRANMAYVNETPWHGLGQALTPGADMETWGREAGLGYDVLSSQVQYVPEGSNMLHTYKERRVLYRSDTGRPLSVVSDSYNVVQPGTILQFVSECVASAGFAMETAGVIDDGRRVWALARVNDGAPVIGHDVVRPYLLAATSYDGTMATTFKFTGIRVVCNNTLSMSAGSSDRDTNVSREKDKTKGAVVQCVRVAHSANPDFESIRSQLGIVLSAWDRFLVESRLMAETKVDERFAIEFLRTLLRTDASIEATKAAEETRAFKRLMALVTGEAQSATLPEANGTAWGLLNAVTWFVDHERGSDKTRLNSAWFGSGSGLKDKAKELILEVVS